MAYSLQEVPSDGTLALLSVSLEYFDRPEIKVYFDGVEDALPWAWVGTADKLISFDPPVPDGTVVLVKRISDLADIRHSLTGGAQFTDEVMDENFTQVLRIAQEAVEQTGQGAIDIAQNALDFANSVIGVADAAEAFATTALATAANAKTVALAAEATANGIAGTANSAFAAASNAEDVALAAEAAVAGKVDTTDPRLADTRDPNPHSHAISDVTGLQTALDGKVGTDALAGKQGTLVSGTNIKTINGESMLGSGNISVTGVPAGCVAHFAVSSAPTGWLKANGALVSRTTYAALFAAIGTTFGAGDGSTTFALPDLRGEFLRGWDDGRGVDAARDLGSAQLDAMQGHKHAQRGSATQSYWAGVDNSTIMQTDTRESGIKTGSPVSDGTNGTPRTAVETRPRNVAMLACIKF